MTSSNLASLTHLNAFSADVAHALHTNGTPPPWPNCNFPTYASARRQLGGGGRVRQRSDMNWERERQRMEPVLMIREDDAASRRAARQAAASRRAARQAAARRIREARLKSSLEEVDGSSISSTTSEEQVVRGVLRKRGGKMKMLVKRWFVLEDAVLYNYRSPAELIEGRESWKLSMPGAAVGFDPRTLRIVIALDGFRTLVLYADTVEEARVWNAALSRAADSTSRGCLCDLDMSRQPENENWDSFRSFAKLQVRTRQVPEWAQDDV